MVGRSFMLSLLQRLHIHNTRNLNRPAQPTSTTVMSIPNIYRRGSFVGFKAICLCFSLTLVGTETVSALKKAIKREKTPTLDHVLADALVLWNVSTLSCA